MLPKGKYLGDLYDLGFDKPETHAIKKDQNMYYAFYAEKWAGNLELRGLDNQEYKIVDYVNDKDYGNVNGHNAKLDVDFERNLLLVAIPK
jgi:alpha-galactosidase